MPLLHGCRPHQGEASFLWGQTFTLKRLRRIASSTLLWLDIMPAPKSVRDRDGSLLTKTAGEKGLSHDIGERLSIARWGGQ
ncbi:hypothetical protein GFM29_08710 [Rhizobium leguminosarum bv. viciae]|nr:hypothetical protein [Rhizobium leguminosarum bv. viciae]